MASQGTNPEHATLTQGSCYPCMLSMHLLPCLFVLFCRWPSSAAASRLVTAFPIFDSTCLALQGAHLRVTPSVQTALRAGCWPLLHQRQHQMLRQHALAGYHSCRSLLGLCVSWWCRPFQVRAMTVHAAVQDDGVTACVDESIQPVE